MHALLNLALRGIVGPWVLSSLFLLFYFVQFSNQGHGISRLHSVLVIMPHSTRLILFSVFWEILKSDLMYYVSQFTVTFVPKAIPSLAYLRCCKSLVFL